MLSLSDWLRLRRIERELGESDPELERLFRTEAPRVEWYRHRGIQSASVLVSILLIMVGVLTGNVFAVIFGFLLWAVSVCLIMMTHPPRIG